MKTLFSSDLYKSIGKLFKNIDAFKCCWLIQSSCFALLFLLPAGRYESTSTTDGLQTPLVTRNARVRLRYRTLTLRVTLT